MSDADLKRPADDKNGDGDAKKAKPSEPKGIVLFSGATDFEDVGRKGNIARSNNTKWKPVRLAALKDVDVVGVYSGPCSVHSFAVTADGEVYAWGRNEKGQLGIGHAMDRKTPTLVEGLKDKFIVQAACGRNHSLFLTDDGDVYACGDNRSAQCATSEKSVTVTTPKQVIYPGAKAKKISCGADFCALVDEDGSLWTWGHPEHGQLGHNSDGSFLEKAGKVNFDYVRTPTRVALFVEKAPKSKAATPVLGVKIVDVTCGSNHSVALDDKNHAFSWGFGGYGRLGHSETGNELVPRMIKFFEGPRRGVTRVVAGGQFTLASAEILGTTYMWGQYNSSKEANMYPKPIQDLSGWMDVRAVACNMKSWMVSADGCVIGCCPSPGYGELGLGEHKKSSANPVEIKTLTDVNIVDLAMGIAHTLYLAKPLNDKEMKKIEALELLEQAEVEK